MIPVIFNWREREYMSEVLCHSLKTFEELEIKYNLVIYGTSRYHIGYQCYKDEKNDIDVYLKVKQEE